MVTRGTLSRRLVLASAAGALATPAIAQGAWPNKPVRVVIAYPPGGPTDLATRITLDKVATKLGQPFIFDNKGGANGIIAAEAAMRAKPDGHTLFATSSMTHAGNPSLYEKLPYDPRSGISSRSPA